MLKKIDVSMIHSSWQPVVEPALAKLDSAYLDWLETHPTAWLPGPNNIFNAFSQPLDRTRFILFGESPYPRAESANGYAFWDAAVTQLWSKEGLSKPVNKATSLRNFMKMLLVANNSLKQNTSPAEIAKLDKSVYITTIDELFGNLLSNGFLLLNASLVLSERNKMIDAKAWQPFMQAFLIELKKVRPEMTLLLLGQIAHTIQKLGGVQFDQLVAEHPYNLSFIHNPQIIEFFKPFNLLNKIL